MHRTLAALLLVALAGPSQAAMLAFTDRAAFEAMLVGGTNIDFEAFESSGGFNYVDPFSVSGVNFDNIGNNYLYVASDTAVNPSYQWNSGATLLFGNTAEGSLLEITLPGGVVAFGMDFMMQSDTNSNGEAGQFDFTVDGNNFSGISQLRPNRTFFGVISDSAISVVTVAAINPVQTRSLGLIDNVTFASQIASVDAPATFVLAGAALLAGGLRRRRRLPAAA